MGTQTRWRCSWPPSPRATAATDALDYWRTMGSAGAIVGQLLGGVLTTAFGWRAIFLIKVPIGIATIAAAARHLADTRGPTQPRLDVRGAALLTAELAAVILTLTRCGRAAGLRDPTIRYGRHLARRWRSTPDAPPDRASARLPLGGTGHNPTQGAPGSRPGSSAAPNPRRTISQPVAGTGVRPRAALPVDAVSPPARISVRARW
jgi:hypothetical protein